MTAKISTVSWDIFIWCKFSYISYESSVCENKSYENFKIQRFYAQIFTSRTTRSEKLGTIATSGLPNTQGGA